jgi:predicted enzyme related to lactoylglutathione lyase
MPTAPFIAAAERTAGRGRRRCGQVSARLGCGGIDRVYTGDHSLGARMEAVMKRVTGIGGIFFNARDPVALRAWYQRHLGIDVQDWGGTAFVWADADGKPAGGTTIWSIGAADSGHFAPSTAPFMVNYRVADLHALVKALRDEGCNLLEKVEESEYGKFAWVIDPEGHKVELWEPPAGQ